MDNTYKIFKSSKPEKEGVTSKSIKNFLLALKENNITMHSVLMFKNNKMIFESYYKPFTRNTLHRMFSVAKSFVSCAIGILADKGVINIDEPIINYFPEYNTNKVSEITKKATIKDLLKMQSPHEKTAFKELKGDDYVKSFFELKPTKISGTIFSYDTSASHTLGALVEKLTKKSLLDFLREEFLNEIGFSKEAYCLTDPKGISLGGSGLMATPLDIALFAHLFLNEGKLWGENKKQILSQEYVKNATSKQSETFVKGTNREEKQGYGYQFWRVCNNGYMCYGMAGQLAVVLPEYNFVLITTADTLETQNGVNRIFDLFWETVYPTLSNAPYPENNEDYESLEQLKNSLQIEPISLENKNFKGNELINKTITLEENEFGLNNLKIEIDETKKIGTLKFTSNKGNFSLDFGFGKQVENVFPFYNHNCVCSGAFFSENMLIVKSHIIGEEIGTVYFQIDKKPTGEGTFFIKKNVGEGFNEFNKLYIFS